MKKYSLFSLYVVGVEDGEDVHYLICKHNALNNVYIEVFTNEKIKRSDSYGVEPLSDYYPPLGICKYKTGEPLMLDKKALLKEYITINSEANLKKGKELSLNEGNILDVNRVLKKGTNMNENSKISN